MARADPYAFASLAAEQIVKGMGISTLPIDPKKIALLRGIEVAAKPIADQGVSGMLVRYGTSSDTIFCLVMWMQLSPATAERIFLALASPQPTSMKLRLTDLRPAS